jgi:hypothetical protein
VARSPVQRERILRDRQPDGADVGFVARRDDQDLSAALDHANTLSLDGHDAWRLPNINELESLVDTAAADAAVWG